MLLPKLGLGWRPTHTLTDEQEETIPGIYSSHASFGGWALPRRILDCSSFEQTDREDPISVILFPHATRVYFIYFLIPPQNQNRSFRVT